MKSKTSCKTAKRKISRCSELLSTAALIQKRPSTAHSKKSPAFHRKNFRKRRYSHEQTRKSTKQEEIYILVFFLISCSFVFVRGSNSFLVSNHKICVSNRNLRRI